MLFVPLNQAIPVAGNEEGGEDDRCKRVFAQWDMLGVPQTRSENPRLRMQPPVCVRRDGAFVVAGGLAGIGTDGAVSSRYNKCLSEKTWGYAFQTGILL